MGYGSPAWAALVAQIRRDPRSEELRNVAADYLIEHDDPRGEYIVLRNKLAVGVDPAEYVVVYDRHRELERARPWAAEIERLGLVVPQPFSGFVEHAHVARDRFARLPELCRHEPLTQLTCGALGALSPELLQLPELADIAQLTLDDLSTPLLESPQLVNVRFVETTQPTMSFADALAASVMRPHKLVLRTWYQQSATADEVNVLATLARSPALDELRELPGNTDEHVAALGDHPLPHLERLDTTRLSRATIERLAAHLDKLVALRIGMNADLVIPTVLANVRSGHLHELAITIAHDDVARVVELVDSQACLALAKLSVRGIPCPLALEQAIRRLAFHGHLREVTLDRRPGARIRIEGVDVIEAS